MLGPTAASTLVQYHLGKVFTKLGISSRSQLEHVLLPAADADLAALGSP
jgi:hypothetical protein